MSFPSTAVSEVKRPPVSCMPSPESPAKRMTTESSCSTGFMATPHRYSASAQPRSGSCPRTGLAALALEPEPGEPVDHQVHEREEHGEEAGDRDQLGIPQRLSKPDARQADHEAGIRQDVPAVQAHEAAEVDPDTREAESADRRGPRGRDARNLPDDGLHEVERRVAE